MIIDTTAWPDDGSSMPAVCIIGAGAAGITLACELDGVGFAVLLLDAGSFKPDAARSRDLYAGSASAPHPDPVEFRRTGLGGTTSIWGGRCVPFDPIDFERREHVPNSGWPIGYDDVAVHYPKALAYCHAGAFDFSVDGSIAAAAATLPGLSAASDDLLERIERYSLPTDFGREHRAKLAASRNVTVLLGARCLRLEGRDADGVVSSALVVDSAGRRRTIRAGTFVLAVGGIETARMLFASDPEGPGLGNAGDNVGRYYACHFENVCARIVVDPGQPVSFSFERTRDGVYDRRKLQFTDRAQRAHRLLNSAFRLHFPDYSDASHGSAVMSTIFLAKSTLIPEYQAILSHGLPATVSPRGAHLVNVVRDLPRLAAFGGSWLTRRVLARRKLPYTLIANADGSYPLEFNSEQIPMRDSRVRLSKDVDRHGVRRVHVDWRIGDADVAAAARAFHVLRGALHRTPHARVEFDDATLDARLRASVPVGGHHIGTARMANGPVDGVVDRDCAVFGSVNLFVASAAVFPVSSHANPTLTVVAMAIRLAAHLCTRESR